MPTASTSNRVPLFLPGIVARSSNNVWSVGEAFQSGSTLSRTLTERWNGTQWTVVNSPNVGSDHNEYIEAKTRQRQPPGFSEPSHIVGDLRVLEPSDR